MSKNVITNEELINRVQKTEEYKQNQMQIDCITKVLVEHGDVPQKLIDWLIDSVKANVTLECKAMYERK